MPRALRISRVAVHRFAFSNPDMALDSNGFNHVYQAGSCLQQTGCVLTIGTDGGVVGEYVDGTRLCMRLLR